MPGYKANIDGELQGRDAGQQEEAGDNETAKGAKLDRKSAGLQYHVARLSVTWRRVASSQGLVTDVESLPTLLTELPRSV